jgi:G6PDH family F420-dependent oxidoreductase
LNEHITGGAWPDKASRRARLRECVDIIRALLAGQTVTHRGAVTVHETKLYSLPKAAPRLFGAAVSADTARWVGSWADGLITVARSEQELRQLVRSFREGGGDGKPMYLQAALSFEATEEEALRQAHRNWRTNAIPASGFNSDTWSPELFDAAASFVRPEDMYSAVRVSADAGKHRAWLELDREIGFERIFVHHVGTNQRRFIEAFSGAVLSRL